MTPVAYVSDSAAIAQTVRDLIEAARSSIVLQMYMFAGNGETEMLHRRQGAFPYAHTVARWLVERKARSPELAIVVVLDTQTIDRVELTRNGGGVLARQILERAGIPVLHANLFGTRFDAARRWPPGARFHDGRWRAVDREAFGRAQQRWQTWHNVEDHRKNLVIDEGAWAAVTSHNFLDIASEWHENLFLVGAPAAHELWALAQQALVSALDLPQRLHATQRDAVTALASRATASRRTTQSTQRTQSAQSPEIISAPPKGSPSTPRTPGTLGFPGSDLPRGPLEQSLGALGDPAARAAARPGRVEVLDTRAIRPRLIEALAASRPGDRVRAASTWFSDRELIEAFAAAAARGVDVQLLTDDLYGLPLGSIPAWFVRRLANLPVIERALDRGLALRIHRSANGRMMHLKTAAFLGERRFVIGGQANYTPNSFSGAWLETGLAIEADHVVDGFLAQFEALWTAATPPEPASELVRRTRHVLLSLVEKTVFTF